MAHKLKKSTSASKLVKLNVNMAALMLSKLCRVWIPNWGWILLIFSRGRGNLCTSMAKGSLLHQGGSLARSALTGRSAWGEHRKAGTMYCSQDVYYQEEVNSEEVQSHWIILQCGSSLCKPSEHGEEELKTLSLSVLRAHHYKSSRVHRAARDLLGLLT